MEKIKISAIVQCRLDSIRLKRKALSNIEGKTSIIHLFNRLSFSKKLDEIIFAIPRNKENDELNRILKKEKCKIFRGSEKNVLERYFRAANKFKSDIIVRITGDCPLVDSQMLDNLLKKFQNENLDYLSNNNPPTYPDGFDIEIFNFKTLKETFLKAKSNFDQEHVTPFMKRSKKIKKYNQQFTSDYSKFRVTLDEEEDLNLIRKIFKNFRNNKKFTFKDVIKFLINNPHIASENQNLIRNEGSLISSGQKLWKKSKKIIPGGTMLFSKRPDLFLPDKWPTYYSKAKGCKIWDLDGKRYFDLSLMGIGTNVLGYANNKVDNAVIEGIKKSNMTTLNSPEEVLLAEKLVQLHPWADMVRFAKTGGEANAIATRICRAASKKDKVAICGYHGWHDWYLSANIKNNNNLNTHLLIDLKTDGVPKSLKGLTFTFQYNNFSELLKITKKNKIGMIMMEVSRNFKPKNNFLKKVRNLCSKKNIILVFDECSTGFRETLGGLHKIYKVEPDIAIFGKSLGNGYPITAIIGKKKIMEKTQNTFISSTFWTEKSGTVAALKTIEIMEKKKTWLDIIKKGNYIVKKWTFLAQKNNLKIQISGLTSMPSFKIVSKNWQKYKTYISQEMFKKKFLASNTIYISISHEKEIIDRYLKILDKIFCIISKYENGKKDFDLLETPVSISTFKRLN